MLSLELEDENTFKTLELRFEAAEDVPGDFRELACRCVEMRITKLEQATTSIDTVDGVPITSDNHLFGVDTFLEVQGVGVFVNGWSIGTGDGLRELCMVQNDTRGAEFIQTAFRFPRPDLIGAIGAKFADKVDKAGFVAFVPFDDTSFSPGDVRVDAFYEGCKTLQNTPVVTTLPPSRNTAIEMLKFPFVERKGMMQYIGTHLAPALSRITSRLSTDTTPEEFVYGTMPENPRLSIIVPLYGRFDFMETQLALFADDPAFVTDIELIYVVDDPRLQRGISTAAILYEQLFGVPFKVLYYDHNLGYAGANNVGAAVARADHMLLLNSDVFPAAPGWCARMLDRFETLPGCGALGARLLYADGSLQHDGMVHVQASFLDNLYICDHPGKGGPPMPVDADTATVEVACTTGACLMVRRSDYEAIGGFDESYLIGDFEDSDLCLALIEQGLKSYVARDIELYHLERQSQSIGFDASWKHQLTIYNGWRHQNKWVHLLSQPKEGV